MMKKIVSTAILVGGLTIGGATFADQEVESEIEVVNENEAAVEVTTESDLYDTIRLIEEGEFDLTEDSKEKALLQDEFAEKRENELETAIETGNEEVVEKILEDQEQHLEAIESILEEAEAIGEDLTELEEVITEIIAKRSRNLLALLEREHLPEQAKAGIRKALANQERAMQRKTTKESESNEVAVEEIEKGEPVLVGNEEEALDELKVENQTVSEDHREEALVKKNMKATNKVERKVEKAEQKYEKTVQKAEQKLNKSVEKATKQNGKPKEASQGKSNNGAPDNKGPKNQNPGQGKDKGQAQGKGNNR
ncbi:DUF5667 domain-containing protein [Anaerobacillus isosaccharinicus]|uniref:DUF5667 domain-containing protein n=1 Tax=Anaerobacillus isosaccharinicus TaxID=1532552 RepID=A0A1S2KVY8_9BACI|nr:DUF5667 domain-containing protein [Anaerobacillus isosaccharinicus]MBA5584778.1 hypothetical protein [Anaerobacillus isosaccharinicus]QOY36857.1 hypothetical protein AWH56_004165 [Anaerobacillus isosaccharinicus]